MDAARNVTITLDTPTCHREEQISTLGAQLVAAEVALADCLATFETLHDVVIDDVLMTR